MGAREDLTPSHRELISLIFIGVFIIFIAIAWNAPILRSILYPFKVLTVAFHESGHALTGICTGAHIESIELDPELGGLTTMRGGIQYITLPAVHAWWRKGYLGSAFIGAVLIFCAFNILASEIAAGFIAALLFLVIFWNRRIFGVIMSLLFIALIICCYFIPHPVGPEILRYFVLFIGVMSAMYSFWDIVEDLVMRKVNESDASKFAEICRCCPAQGWGVLWAGISLIFIGGAVLAGIVVFK